MSGLADFTALMHLFEEAPVWTVEDVAARLGVSARTAYRHVRHLTQSGFLDPVGRSGYVLGPAFIRYERLIRQGDPLVGIAAPAMADILDVAGQEAAVLLCRRFRDCVMSVHSIEGRVPHLPTSYERGVTMSLFLGAPAKVILANQPDRALRALYLAHEAEIRAAGWNGWSDFRAQLKAIRIAGFSITSSEVGAGRIGIAAPILRPDGVVASICAVISAHRRFETDTMGRLTEAVRHAAKTLSCEPAARTASPQPISEDVR